MDAFNRLALHNPRVLSFLGDGVVVDLLKIIGSAPVNKQAALVTQQPKELNDFEKAQCELRSVTNAIEKAKLLGVKKSEIRLMGKKKLEIQERIRVLKGYSKNTARNQGKAHLEFYFMDEARKVLHPLQFKAILKAAREARGDIVRYHKGDQ